MSSVRAAWWRALYALLGSRVTIAVAGTILDLIAAMRGPQASAHVLGVFEQRFVYSGWPLYEMGWVNVHMSRVATLVRRRGRPVAAKPGPSPGQAIRVAMVGRFVGLLGFPRELVDACPADLVIADISHSGRFASYLQREGRQYAAFDLDSGAANAAGVAQFINHARPDLVINIGQKEEAFEIVDLIEAPCIANLCAGSDLMHHRNVDLQFHGQPEADYFVVNNRMFCGTSRSYVPSSRVQTITGYIDPRGLLSEPRAKWAEREPLIVCHGSLFKFAAPAFRAVLMQVLVRNPQVRLALMGRDSGAALASILKEAADAGVRDRVDYLGAFSAVRGEDGMLPDQGWERLLGLLRRARLAPDAFPLGGGSSRFEAYATGVPSVHLAVRFDEDAWGKPQPGTCEVPSLAAPSGTARSIADYAALCDRLLVDGKLADRLAQEQLELARRVGDAKRWWAEILDGHAHWLTVNRAAS
ncbi:MAG TPA: hypothetical protein VFZ31_06570 [Vicinamibacterales bacterium]